MLPADLQALYDTKNKLYHPHTEEQVGALVRYAAANHLQVRVRGAAQSVDESVFTDGFPDDDTAVGPNINLQLDQLRSASFDDERLEVTVGAGWNLAYDPFDPSAVSTATNGLFQLLATKGWVLPNVPAVAHQTIAGFMATGSEGCSVTHSFGDQVCAIRLVDGTGQATTFRRCADLDDPFYAVGVSLGLLGVVVSVTLACLPGFTVDGYQSVNIVGTEITTTQDTAPYAFGATIDPEKPTLESLLRTTSHMRLLWWPYSELQWLITWQAHPMTRADEPFVGQGPNPYDPPFPAITLPGMPLSAPPKAPKAPIMPITPTPITTRLPAEMMASLCFWLINNWPNWYKQLTLNLFSEAPSSPFWSDIEQAIEANFPAIYKSLMSLYFSPEKPEQHFWDVWWEALAMDTFEFSTKIFNLNYTELWVPLDQAQQVIALMDTHYKTGGYAATEAYTVEISGARQSPFWLSPGYQTDTVRLNIMHFADSADTSAAYFTQFWALLQANKIPFRPHWGKMLPPAADPATGAAYLSQQYPKLDHFKALRSKMDPGNVFLTSYWREHIAI
ncbi:D-arabinono-1,4-lactone oxidase [Fibrella aquatilis]|uniref:FAD-binding protein n=1 Tax=Fibrella aquatilis TaxID=2817059 RepID=A0A939G8M0_9BACT|nr:D-arabinono-1,4-lactone oxidase [Fibrella aquatilis]MBO0931803.1 FAD-binding protein [Fibrella aquatilis]